jgi:protocatechuate 3,4-dioxygenase beta subunit
MRNLLRMKTPTSSSCDETALTTRRGVIQALGSLAAMSLLPACGGPLANADAGSDAPIDRDAATPDAATPRDDAGGDAMVTSRWASGGTVAMTAVATYPAPFTANSPSPCALTLPTTLGPCFYDSPNRVDVSEGYPGLPMRLVLRVVDAMCRPIAGARVDIWHTGHTGLYSGGPIPFCTGGDPDAIAHGYGRGSQTTDEDGLVAFHTCFPGAYDGRALHIHFQVFPTGATMASIVSQIFFPQPLIDEVFASHPDYVDHGVPDTTNARDAIYRSVGPNSIVEYARMTDGAMQAWKEVVIRGA